MSAPTHEPDSPVEASTDADSSTPAAATFADLNAAYGTREGLLSSFATFADVARFAPASPAADPNRDR